MKFDFSKNQKVAADKFEETVPQDFRGLYTKGDDGYTLDSDHAGVKAAVAAITGLSTALNASRTEAAAYKGRIVDLTPLKDYGDTPEAVAAKVQELLAAKPGKPEDVEKQIKAAREALAAEHGKQTEALTKRTESLTGQLHRLLISGQATSSLAELGAVDVDLALPHVVSRVRVVEEDGTMQVRVVGDDGSDRFSGSTGKHMTIRELVGEMREQKKFGPLFRSDGPAGGGGPPSHRAAPAGQQLTSTQKIAAGVAARQTR